MSDDRVAAEPPALPFGGGSPAFDPPVGLRGGSFPPAYGYRAVSRDRLGLHALLFALTVFTTLLTGASLQISFAMKMPVGLDGMEFYAQLFQHPTYLFYGLPFCFTLLGILLAHEMGHYVACRYYGIPATLPFFLPAPIGPIGTFGAFIRIKAPITNKKALFDIGIAGPLAGFALALPAMIVGIHASRVVDFAKTLPSGGAIETIGEPLLFKAISRMLQGNLGGDLYLHPIAFAAWFGCLATALNLFPIGQLDGGHIMYAVTGRLSRYLSRAFWAATIVLGGLAWSGWLFWSLLVFFIGLDHPPVLDDREPIGNARLLLFLLAILVFAACFVPVPMSIEQLR